MIIKIFILRLIGRWKLLKTKTISRKIFLGRNVQFFGLKNIIIKDNCTIGDNCVFTVNDRNNDSFQLIINSNVYIGRDCFFAVGGSIIVGDYSIFGNKCAIMCSDHDFSNPLIPYALSGCTLDKSIKIGVNCWFGYDVSIVGNVNIGHGSIIGAKAVITKDVPPFSMVIGNPARIVKRYDFDSKTWKKGEVINDSKFNDEKIYLQYFEDSLVSVPLMHHSASSSLGNL